jgi:tetratricopeptide (TPR) repeat protein
MSMCERDYAAADRAVSALPPDGCFHEGLPFPPKWCQGLLARARGDEPAAQAAFKEARASVATTVEEQPNYAEAVCVLGVLDAAVGNKESAVKNGLRAVKLFPLNRNAIEGAVALHYLALIYTWTGEKDLAVKTLAAAVETPASISFGELRLHPFWDPLRGDPRFEKVVASLAPK